MSDKDSEWHIRIKELVSEIEEGFESLEKIDRFYQEVLTDMPSDPDKRKAMHAVSLAECYVNFYTCLETLFFRISQQFENHLSKDRWHKDLLHKMHLEIKDVRPAVISDDTYFNLLEILNFRHFRRYYFEFHYDWDKLDMINKKYTKAHKSVLKDLKNWIQSIES